MPNDCKILLTFNFLFHNSMTILTILSNQIESWKAIELMPWSDKEFVVTKVKNHGPGCSIVYRCSKLSVKTVCAIRAHENKISHFKVWRPNLEYCGKYFCSSRCTVTRWWNQCDQIGQNFIIINGQILKNNIAIWSHWAKIDQFFPKVASKVATLVLT